MKLKKKVKVNLLNYSDRENYEKHASICPICGQNIIEDHRSLILDNQHGEYDWLYKMTAKKNIFQCPSCSCQWEVKTFRGTKKYVKS